MRAPFAHVRVDPLRHSLGTDLRLKNYPQPPHLLHPLSVTPGKTSARPLQKKGQIFNIHSHHAQCKWGREISGS